MLDVVIKAKEMGIYTIVCDYSVTSPAKLIADKSYDISTSDIGTLVKIGIEEKIDGVFTAFEDLNTWNALKICQRLRLPFYATEKQLELTSNKMSFKDFCRKCDVSVVPGYFATSLQDITSLRTIVFPIIIKPADSYGTKGITVCYNSSDIQSAFEKAVSFSKQKKVIVEPFFEGYGVEMYYTVIKGVPYLSAIADRYVYKQEDGTPPLPTATIFPSKHIVEYCDEMNYKVKNLIRQLEINDGLLLFQSVLDKGAFYLYEMAYRLTGEQHYQIIQKETNVDLLKMMIELSLKGIIDNKYKIVNYDKECLPFPACNLAVLLKKGKIKSIKRLDEILRIPEVISYVQTLKEGDEIRNIGNYGQMCIRLNFFAKDWERLREIIDTINENLQIISDHNSDMILTKFMEKNLF
jgi:biotin carboxylase